MLLQSMGRSVPRAVRLVAHVLGALLALLILNGCLLFPNLAPSATLTATPSSGHAPLRVELDASESTDADGFIVAYRWTIEGALPRHGSQTEHTFMEAGTYAVELLLRDEDGAEAVETATIVVSPPNQAPTAMFTLAPAAAAIGETVWFDATSSEDADGSIDSYRWDFGDGALGGGDRASHSYAEAGTYTATLTVTDDDGGIAEVSRFILVAGDGQGPIASITPSQTTTAIGEMVQFDGSSSHSPTGEIVDYAWTFGDGSTGTGPVVGHAYASEGTFSVTLAITDNSGATATTSAQVTVGHSPEPSGDTITRSFWWSYDDVTRSLQVAIPSELYAWSVAQSRDTWPMRDYDEYVLNPLDDDLMARLAGKLSLGSYRATVENALAFVQMGIAYVPDPGLFEYPKYPVETLADEGGDCEDTAILYASLIRTLGHGALLVGVDTDGDNVSNHMVVFVPIDGTFNTCGMDCVWEYRGQIYALAETAVDGGYLPLGQDPWGLDASDILETWDVSRVDHAPRMIKRVVQP